MDRLPHVLERERVRDTHTHTHTHESEKNFVLHGGIVCPSIEEEKA
jgi:hypothetical protein